MSPTPLLEVVVDEKRETLKGFPIHTVQTAPGTAWAGLDRLQHKLGMIPNLYAVLAESPAALSAVLLLGEEIAKSRLLTSIQKQVIQLAASYANGCAYCMASHTTSALRQGMPAQEIAALRAGQPLEDPQLEALRAFTIDMVVQRGQLMECQKEDFLLAGFTRAQMLEVVLNVALKTITNYAEHLAKPPLDELYAAHVWTRPEE